MFVLAMIMSVMVVKTLTRRSITLKWLSYKVGSIVAYFFAFVFSPPGIFIMAVVLKFAWR
jgi:hypothetical protein